MEMLHFIAKEFYYTNQGFYCYDLIRLSRFGVWWTATIYDLLYPSSSYSPCRIAVKIFRIWISFS